MKIEITEATKKFTQVYKDGVLMTTFDAFADAEESAAYQTSDDPRTLNRTVADGYEQVLKFAKKHNATVTFNVTFETKKHLKFFGIDAN